MVYAENFASPMGTLVMVKLQSMWPRLLYSSKRHMADWGAGTFGMA
jgi:hypothetical protein